MGYEFSQLKVADVSLYDKYDLNSGYVNVKYSITILLNFQRWTNPQVPILTWIFNIITILEVL